MYPQTMYPQMFSVPGKRTKRSLIGTKHARSENFFPHSVKKKNSDQCWYLVVFGSRSVLLSVLVANLYLQNVFLRSDQTEIKFKKKKKQDQNRVEEDEERKKKKRKKLTTEQSAEIQARLGGVGVRACRVKSREMRWVSLRERIDNILGTIS